jgi:di/tricarboxylate transporter
VATDISATSDVAKFAKNVQPPAPASKAPGFFAKYKRELGFILGIVVFLAIFFMPAQQGLPRQGQQCLALSLMTVVFWATGVAHPGYTSVLLLCAWVWTKTADATVVFKLWSNPMIFLVVGGYLIAAAVESSGLGKRIAYVYILRYVNSFTSIIASAYILGFILSFMIPHPWPRSFMIMSVMAIMIKAMKLPPKDAANIGLAVFASSVPVSLILLTGDSMINTIALGFAGVQPSWIKWLWYMGVPGVVASVLLFLLQVWLFKPTAKVEVKKDEIRELLKGLGSFTRNEKVVMFWVGLAIIVWATDFIHHIHPAWVAIGCALILSMPGIGDVLKPADWGKVPIATMFFLTAALGIGIVGGVTGMNKWVASVVLPSHVPVNIFMLVLLLTVATVVIHFFLGSVLAVMGIVIPSMLVFTANSGINPLVVTLIVYTAVACHFVFPFHHMNVLVGEGEAAGKYGPAEVLKLGLPMTLIVFFVTLCVEIPWWKMIGLIK